MQTEIQCQRKFIKIQLNFKYTRQNVSLKFALVHQFFENPTIQNIEIKEVSLIFDLSIE